MILTAFTGSLVHKNVSLKAHIFLYDEKKNKFDPLFLTYKGRNPTWYMDKRRGLSFGAHTYDLPDKSLIMKVSYSYSLLRAGRKSNTLYLRVASNYRSNSLKFTERLPTNIDLPHVLDGYVGGSPIYVVGTFDILDRNEVFENKFPTNSYDLATFTDKDRIKNVDYLDLELFSPEIKIIKRRVIRF